MKIRLTIPQAAVYRDRNRFRVLVAGRRFGKTFLALPSLVKMADGVDREVWYVAPTYRQAKMIAWRKLKDFVGSRARKINESELSIDLDQGSRLCLKGADNYNSLRGPGLDGVILDEFADIAPEAWFEVLRPMLSDRLGSAMFIGTPKGRNHFYELAQSARTEPGWSYHSYTTLQGGNVQPTEIASAQRDLDERTFRQEYEASFENFSGVVYFGFDREKNVKPLTYDPLAPLCWSLDFNVNPMSSLICQIEDRTTRADAMMGYRARNVNVLDEIVLPNSNVVEACREFVRRAHLLAGGRLSGVQIYGDPAGHATGHVGASDWEIVRQFLAAEPSLRYAMNVPSRHPAVKDRVNAVNGMLCSHSGERRLFLDPKCKQLLKDFDQVTWKEDSNGNMTGEIDKSNSERTHTSDALGYLVEEEFGLKGFVGFRQERIL